MKLSIITSVYNNSATIAEALTSVLSQTHGDVEYIVIDGASTDGTVDIVKEFQENISAFISEPDSGIYDGLNTGILLATGAVIGFLHSDDFYPDKHILSRVEEVFQDDTIDACYGDLIYVDSEDTSKIVRYWRAGTFDPKKMYWGWMPPHPTFFVRASVYEKYGSFNLGLGSAADYEIMLRFLLKHEIKVAYIPEVMVHMRTGGVSNANLTNRLAANQMDRKAWEINGLKPYPWTLYAKPIRKIGQWFVKG